MMKKFLGFNLSYNEKDLPWKLGIYVDLIWGKKKEDDFPELLYITTNKEDTSKMKQYAYDSGYKFVFSEQRETNHQFGNSDILNWHKYKQNKVVFGLIGLPSFLKEKI